MIQGYLPTVTRKGKKMFCAFNGGLTKDYLKSHCVNSQEQAYEIARSNGEDIYDVPGFKAVNEKNEIDFKCQWELDENMGAWETSCGNAFTLETGDPKENGLKHCCYCGAELEQVKIKEPSK